MRKTIEQWAAYFKVHPADVEALIDGRVQSRNEDGTITILRRHRRAILRAIRG